MTDPIKPCFTYTVNKIDIVCIEKLIASAKTDVSGKWISKDELKEYTDRIISMCIVAAVNTLLMRLHHMIILLQRILYKK